MKKNITGIILSGGKSTRMGSDKNLLRYNKVSFTQNIINSLKPYVDEILIISNNNEHDVFNEKRICDEIKDFGPVAGIYTGLKASKSDYNIVLSCDVPKVDAEVFEKLILNKNNNHEVIQFKYLEQTTPLIALYHKKGINIFNLAIKNKIQKLRFVIKQLNVKTIEVDKRIGEKLANINTPKDLKKYKI